MSIKSVGGVPVQPRHRLSCHCGAVVLELDLPEGIVNPRRCDCSICRRKGAVVASVPLDGIHIVQGQEHLDLYQFNTHVARHYFCSQCGIYTHHQRRSFPDQYGYNVGCLEGINPFLLGEVPVNDGVNHPADRRDQGAAVPSLDDERFMPTKPPQRMPVVLAPGEGRSYGMGRIRAVFKADGPETGAGYSISEWWLEPDTAGPGAHSHDEDDVFYVLEGTVSVRVGDAWVEAPKGSFVLVPAGVTHDFENRSAARAGLLNVSYPGNFEQHMPGIVEWFEAHPPGRAGA